MNAIADQAFSATMTLTEAELRILKHLSEYEGQLTKAIRAHVTDAFDGELFTVMLRRWRNETNCIIRGFDAARDAFETRR